MSDDLLFDLPAVQQEWEHTPPRSFHELALTVIRYLPVHLDGQTLWEFYQKGYMREWVLFSSVEEVDALFEQLEPLTIQVLIELEPLLDEYIGEWLPLFNEEILDIYHTAKLMGYDMTAYKPIFDEYNMTETVLIYLKFAVEFMLLNVWQPYKGRG